MTALVEYMHTLTLTHTHSHTIEFGTADYAANFCHLFTAGLKKIMDHKWCFYAPKDKVTDFYGF